MIRRAMSGPALDRDPVVVPMIDVAPSAEEEGQRWVVAGSESRSVVAGRVSGFPVPPRHRSSAARLKVGRTSRWQERS